MTKLVAASVGHLNGKAVCTRKALGENLTVLFEFPTRKNEYENTFEEYITRSIRGRLGVKPTAGQNCHATTNTSLRGKTELLSIALSCNLSNFLVRLTPSLDRFSLKPQRHELTNANVPTAEESIRECCWLHCAADGYVLSNKTKVSI
ncbi:hypothetical protein [Pseudomonas orientalis]|uniref:hypothetical protein n=1 Tax=Pseudomonas orientalis TaxID=76758 RepID=UPI000F589DD1|nr:hypothetical protein [Pseudomonas orientalis]